MATLTCLDLGRAAYAPALALQRRLAERVRAADGRDAFLVLLEHDPPVITLGRRGRDADVLATREQLDAAGVEVHHTTRGGEVTWHGPGQLVGYAILHLRRHGLTLRGYVERLEDALIRALGHLGVAGRRAEGLAGVWVGMPLDDAKAKPLCQSSSPSSSSSSSILMREATQSEDEHEHEHEHDLTGRAARSCRQQPHPRWEGERKIAAVGVAVERWVTYHGFALNVGADLSGFASIVPCGGAGAHATSLSQCLGRPVAVAEAAPEVAAGFAEAFGFDNVQHPAPEALPTKERQ